MANWDFIHKTSYNDGKKPIAGFPQLLKLLSKEKANRVLDLGCGSGRHAVALAKAGFSVYAMDISKVALAQTRNALRKSGADAKLTRASCYEQFPFKDGFFDAVVSVQVIQHNVHRKILGSISEIVRVLKKGGIAYVTVSSKRVYPSQWKNKKGERLFIPLDGEEEGVPHFLYTKRLLAKDFSMFSIAEISEDGDGRYIVLAVK